MEHISSFDAKTHFSKLLAEVLDGKEFIITKHNKDVAKLTKYSSERQDVNQVIKDIKKNRVKVNVSLMELLEYRDYGRK